MRRVRLSALWGAAAGIVLAGVLARAQNFDKVEIQAEKLTEHVYALKGSGGNIGLCVGEDGAFVIDDQYAPLTKKILAAIAAVTDKPVRFVINTHWHGDHAGGNENLGREGAVIVAQENVRKRLAMDQIFVDASGEADTSRALAHAGLPVITFREEVDFHVNGDDLHVFHVEHAHTDGDAIIRFANANVVHMGDTFFNGFYPFIDLRTGGSVDGYIAAVDKVLGMVDGASRIIPGHGPVTDRAGLQKFHDMLVACRERVRQAVAQGQRLDQVQGAKPTADFDPVWGGSKFMPPQRFVQTLYEDLAHEAEAGAGRK